MWIFLKVIDPGNGYGMADPWVEDGIVSPKTRFNELWYSITVNPTTNCPAGATWCSMPIVSLGPNRTIMPLSLIPATGTCADKLPAQGTCLQVLTGGNCNTPANIANDMYAWVTPVVVFALAMLIITPCSPSRTPPLVPDVPRHATDASEHHSRLDLELMKLCRMHPT